MTSNPDLSALRIDRSEPPASSGRGRLPWILVVLVLVLAIAAFAWMRLAPRAIEVSVGTAEASGGGSVSGAGISANGYVVARTKASVSSKVLGRLSWIGVTEGARVQRGQVLARIENADYQAAVNAARANEAQFEAQLGQARRELQRAQALRKENVVSDADLEAAQTKLDVLLAQLNSARSQAKLSEANLDNTRVVAPFSGTILRKDAEVGEIVAPSSAGGGLTRTAIVTMADLQTLEVEVDVNEAYIAQVTNGQAARITLDAYPDTSFAGTVRQVVPTADRQKATVLVKVAIDDKDPRILPEMGARVDFVPEGQTVAQAAAPRKVYVPKAALVGGGRVWIVADGKAKSQSVTTGVQDGARVEVKVGLAGDEVVIVSPPEGLKDGAPVRVQKP